MIRSLRRSLWGALAFLGLIVLAMAIFSDLGSGSVLWVLAGGVAFLLAIVETAAYFMRRSSKIPDFRPPDRVEIELDEQ